VTRYRDSYSLARSLTTQTAPWSPAVSPRGLRSTSQNSNQERVTASPST
jgi:hypothetical protein